MNHPLRCKCGTLAGFVAHPRRANHGICYCRDCQAFAHFLGRPGEILDERGGTEVVQVLPANVTFTQGAEALACVRLSETGLVRWYAACCRTAIGNTLATAKVSFVGLIRDCLEVPGQSLSEAFGPVRALSFTRGAKGEPKPRQAGMLAMMARLMAAGLGARLDGRWRRTPFFRVEEDRPVAEPKVLSASERAATMAAVDGVSPPT